MNKKLILLSGGIGSRTGLEYPKQYHEVNGVSLINFLLGNVYSEFDEIIMVIDKEYESKINSKFNVTFAPNGQTRLESLQSGFKKLNGDEELIFIHEAARPLLDKKDIDAHIESHKEYDGIVTTEKVVDTMFRIDDKGVITDAIGKTEIVKGYNPQSYKGNIINNNMDEILSATGDKDLLQILDTKVKTIEGINDLRKVTTKKDIEWIEGEI